MNRITYVIKNSLGAEIEWDIVYRNMNLELLGEVFQPELSLQEIYDTYCRRYKEKMKGTFYFETVIRNKKGALLDYSTVWGEMKDNYKDALIEYIITFNNNLPLQECYNVYCDIYKQEEGEEFFTELISPTWIEGKNVYRS